MIVTRARRVLLLTFLLVAPALAGAVEEGGSEAAVNGPMEPVLAYPGSSVLIEDRGEHASFPLPSTLPNDFFSQGIALERRSGPKVYRDVVRARLTARGPVVAMHVSDATMDRLVVVSKNLRAPDLDVFTRVKSMERAVQVLHRPLELAQEMSGRLWLPVAMRHYGEVGRVLKLFDGARDERRPSAAVDVRSAQAEAPRSPDAEEDDDPFKELRLLAEIAHTFASPEDASDGASVLYGRLEEAMERRSMRGHPYARLARDFAERRVDMRDESNRKSLWGYLMAFYKQPIKDLPALDERVLAGYALYKFKLNKDVPGGYPPELLDFFRRLSPAERKAVERALGFEIN